MGFGSYLKDKAWLILVGSLLVIAIALMLRTFAVDGALIAYLCVILLSSAFFLLLVEWLRKRRFYDDLVRVTSQLDKAYLATELVERPRFAEGIACYDALARATKAMNDRIGGYSLASREYQSYIETWIHEVKTPISAAHLYAANHESPDCDAMDAQVDRIAGYVDQVLYYARGTVLEKDYSIKAVQLESLVKSAVRKNARMLIDASISPKFCDLDFTVYADAKWMEFVISQIIANAVKYRRLPDKTKPAASTPDSPTIVFRGQQKDNGLDSALVVLSITDNGTGIPESDIPRVFDKGFTGENGRRFAQSTGIGLYLCRQLCKKMGIDISLDSEVATGTTVSLSFPVSKMHFAD